MDFFIAFCSHVANIWYWVNSYSSLTGRGLGAKQEGNAPTSVFGIAGIEFDPVCALRNTINTKLVRMECSMQ